MISKTTLVALTIDVLNTEAPSEVPLVELYADAIDEGKSTSKGPLGFGVEVEGAVVLLLPLVLGFFQELLKNLSHDLAKGLATQASETITSRFRKLLASRGADAKVERQQAVEATAAELRKAGLAAEKAEATAAAIVNTIVAKKELISVES